MNPQNTSPHPQSKRWTPHSHSSKSQSRCKVSRRLPSSFALLNDPFLMTRVKITSLTFSNLQNLPFLSSAVNLRSPHLIMFLLPLLHPLCSRPRSSLLMCGQIISTQRHQVQGPQNLPIQHLEPRRSRLNIPYLLLTLYLRSSNGKQSLLDRRNVKKIKRRIKLIVKGIRNGLQWG